MNMNSKFTRILILALAVVMLAAQAVPAMAAATLEASKLGKVEFDKSLTVDQYAVLPGNLEFSFTLSAETVDAAIGAFDPQTSSLEGITVTAATGTNSGVSYTSPTIKVSYATADKTSSANATETIKKGFVIDFNSVEWAAPGVYRYKLVEVNGGLGGITYSDATYYIDVFVQYDAAGEDLEIANIVVSTGTTYSADGDGFDNGTKVDATPDGDSAAKFANTVAAYDVTVTKSVTGNQGNKNKEFSFNVTLTGLVAGGTYHYTDATGDHTFTATNGTHTLSDVKLKDGQSITFVDLPYAATYDVTETATSAEGYKTTAAVSGTDTTVTTNTANGQGAGGQVVDNNSGDNPGLTGNATVTFTNNKQGTIPTGVLLTIAPFAALMLVGLAGVVIVLKKKKN